MSHNHERHRSSVAGPLYVVNGWCILCGIPFVIALTLFGGFGSDGGMLPGAGHCCVKRQPRSGAELDAMFETIARQELACLRHRGADAHVAARLWMSGEGARID